MILRLRSSARRRATGASGIPRGRRGFSLVELMVAMMLLTVGVLGLASVSAYAIRQDSVATRANSATLVAQSRMERLRSRRCDDIVSSSSPVTTNNVTESWTVTNVGAKTKTVKGTFTYKTRRGATRTIEEYTTILCNP
jgi:type IV pilus modification protein PilV